MPEFDPTQPIRQSPLESVPHPRLQGERDPHTPFVLGQNAASAVVMGTAPSALTAPENTTSDSRTSRRNFLGLLGAGVVAAAGAYYSGTKIVETVGDAFERISGAEAKERAVEVATEIMAAGRPYLSQVLNQPAYPHLSSDQNEPYNVSREATSSRLDLEGIFGYSPMEDADAELVLEVYSPERPFDGVARTNLQVEFKDKLHTLHGDLKDGQLTFDDIFDAAELALEPKDPNVGKKKGYPGDGLELTRVAILAVDEKQSPVVAGWYAIEITDDGVYVLKPGSDEQGYDDDNKRGKDWLTPDKPEFSAAVKQTLKALQAGLKDFSDAAKTAR